MKPTPLPPVEELHRIFRLDAETGRLYWRPRDRSSFLDPASNAERFNRVFAGKRADKLTNRGYYRVRVRIDGKQEIFSAHRVIWKMVHGRDPMPEVDHIDRDPTNNRPCNLREATRADNAANRNANGLRKRDLPPCIYATKNGRFRAQINSLGRIYHAGTFNSVSEASRAIEALRAELKTAA